jgi:hypothetical protein
MTLSSMVVSRDWQEISVLECILSSLHMEVWVEAETQAALERISHSKIDALIVDCDLEGSADIIQQLQSSQTQPSTVPLVIMGKRQCVASLNETGAMFTFEKPISVEKAVRTLSAARCMILDGRLRYQRVDLDIQVSLRAKNNMITNAHLVNLSEGGMRIYSDQPIDAEGLQIRWEIPGAQSELNAQAEVVWHDDNGHVGVRFVKVPPQHQKALQLWLAQQFLAN